MYKYFFSCVLALSSTALHAELVKKNYTLINQSKRIAYVSIASPKTLEGNRITEWHRTSVQIRSVQNGMNNRETGQFTTDSTQPGIIVITDTGGSVYLKTVLEAKSSISGITCTILDDEISRARKTPIAGTNKSKYVNKANRTDTSWSNKKSRQDQPIASDNLDCRLEYT
tara:strand:- start:977 stop:1486 length:510 start_codon:yes stop_codon:yes gene_type:complete